MRDPLAQSDGEGNLSVGGINPRFNGLAIDGSLQQDDFGLGANTYATDRSPINIDAVESASLVASDYDVTTAGFTGGLVNLTIKSGTNEWDGSAFYYWKTDDYYGDKFDGGTYDPGPIDETEYGVTLGGPIIKDKLFFFVSYDEFESASSFSYAEDDSDEGLLPGFFDALGPIINTSLGYDPGTRPDTANTPDTSERTLVKLDWNINDNHRASYTFQETLESGTSASDWEEFESAWYDIPLDLEANTFQLFSDWNDNFSTTLRINTKDFSRGQICRAGPDVAHIEIDNLLPADVVGTPLEGTFTEEIDNIIAGCDRFRHANEFEDERTQIMLKADYFAGDHVISFGIEQEDFSLFNVFLPSARGRFQFDGYDNLVAGNTDLDYINATSNISSEGGATWGYDKWSLFLQDTWQVTPDFELGFGIRYEEFDQSDAPAFSQSVMDQYGVDTSKNLDGLDLFMPRVSFRWDLSDRTTLSGGFGLFAGGDPKVWTSNAFSTGTFFATGLFDRDEYEVAPYSIPQDLLDDVSNGVAVPIDFIAADFETPSDWKASLRLEQDFDIGSSEGYVFTAQYLYTTTKDGFQWTNLAQTALGSGVAPDGRPIYSDLEFLDVSNLTELGNYSDGTNHVIALGLSKYFDSGFDFSASYAYQDVELVTAGSSSRGVSNWRAVFGTDRNNPSAKISPYQIEHSLKLSLGYEKDFFGTGQSATRFDAFMRRLAGDTYSHVFDVDDGDGEDPVLFGRGGNGEEPYDTDLIYIPTGASDSAVVYATGFDQPGFEAYVNDHVKGTGIIKANSSRTSWNTTMDLRIQQEIPGLSFLGNSLGDNNFRLVLDVRNFLNLLNDDWGRWTNGPRDDENPLVDADLVLASDVALNGVDGATKLLGNDPRTMCLSQSDCVYRFNDWDDNDINDTSRSGSVYQIRLGVRFDF